MMAFIEQEAKEKVDEIDAKVAEKRSDNLSSKWNFWNLFDQTNSIIKLPGGDVSGQQYVTWHVTSSWVSLYMKTKARNLCFCKSSLFSDPKFLVLCQKLIRFLHT